MAMHKGVTPSEHQAVFNNYFPQLSDIDWDHDDMSGDDMSDDGELLGNADLFADITHDFGNDYMCTNAELFVDTTPDLDDRFVHEQLVVDDDNMFVDTAQDDELLDDDEAFAEAFNDDMLSPDATIHDEGAHVTEPAMHNSGQVATNDGLVRVNAVIV